jgi:hypothetical protein
VRLDVIELEKAPPRATPPIRRDVSALTAIALIHGSRNGRGRRASVICGVCVCFKRRLTLRMLRSRRSSCGTRFPPRREPSFEKLTPIRDKCRLHRTQEIAAQIAMTRKIAHLFDQLEKLCVSRKANREAIGRQRFHAAVRALR